MPAPSLYLHSPPLFPAAALASFVIVYLAAAGASVAAPVLGLLKTPGFSKVLYLSFTVIMGERFMSVLPDLR